MTGSISPPGEPNPVKMSPKPGVDGNLADAVRHRASMDPIAPALVGDNASVTWAELDDRVDACAAGLLQLAAPPPDSAAAGPGRVAIALPNVPEFAIAFFGTLRAGLVAVPINPGYTARELGHVLGDSGCFVLIGTAAVLAAAETIRGQLAHLTHTYRVGTGDDAPPFDDLCLPGRAVASSTGGEDLAVLLYTSGTAGAPRGAMLTHRALIANHRQVEQVVPPIVQPADTVLLALPLFHAFGLNSGLGAIAWHGATGVLVERFDPVETLRIIADRHVSVITAVPQMYAAWSHLPELGESLSSVRVAVSGAAPLDAAIARRFLDGSRHPIFEGYGLTETSPVVAVALASPVPKTGSIGRPIPGVEVKLVAGDGSEIARIGATGLLDAKDDFDDDAGGVPGTDPGEIVVRGENLFNGYWPDSTGGPGADGWWPTGDVAYADADGDLFIVDRLGDLILVSGFNVYPHEVELVLAAHPAVAEAAVVGVPDPHTGEAVKAYVVRGPGEATSAADLIAHCERSLARFKCPGVIEFVAELPHSATGKVRKGTLRAGAI